MFDIHTHKPDWYFGIHYIPPEYRLQFFQLSVRLFFFRGFVSYQKHLFTQLVNYDNGALRLALVSL